MKFWTISPSHPIATREPTMITLRHPLLVLCAATMSGALPAALAAADVPKAALPANVASPAGDGLWIPSGYMGETASITMDPACSEKPHEGSNTCTKVIYAKNDGWGGVVWQSPQDDWGNAAGGFNLNGATKLVVWARGKDGGEKVKFGFGVIGKDKPFPDSDKGEIEVVLTSDWKEYDIPLAGKDLSDIKSGFDWVVGGQGGTLTFFLSQVHYEK